MKRRKLPNYKALSAQHHRRAGEVARQVEALFGRLGESLAYHASILDDPEALDHPAYRHRANGLVRAFADDLVALISISRATEWRTAYEQGDRLRQAVARQLGVPANRLGLASNYPDALTAYQRRRERTLPLSPKVWELAQRGRMELEMLIEEGMSENLSPAELNRTIRQHLKYPDALFRRVRERATGVLKPSKRMQDYHPGRGVYKSAHKNAMRLARTEVNIAYRTAEQTRWREDVGVVGYEVKRSGRGYPCEVCEAFAGKYPKEFVWGTWHPHCMCYAVPILKTDDEFFADLMADAPSSESVNRVTELPEGLRSWIATNSDRLAIASARGTLPRFVIDNRTLLYKKSKETSRNTATTIEDLSRIYRRYPNGGVLRIATVFTKDDTSKHDYQKIKRIGEKLSRLGHEVIIAPKLHYKDDKYRVFFGILFGTPYERKCPDLMVDGQPYEFEGFARPWKKAKVGRMISHGLKQAQCVIIDNTKGCNDRYLVRLARIHKNLKELWVYEKGEVRLVYKSTVG